ncbi:acyl-CoA-binding domain-containing protein 4 [Myripristis murdjan]|uniref:acyl-CoA-binding domain-containing protein 4 n=1 Tax=Myripristis murdjan TaxID=586833 RepID=UPI001175E298|nr:acyl-CoA-binding domain-containing protein 4-like [Myripristis murdjan]XP_029934526.1 acyl-CoA-binding domain-containing protein 4-like [Myripristis murdjan]
MLRFYSLYKQAVCGPCTMSRPGFWDPVGRYKWDAWSRLGEMSSESAMAAYVDEMKKVAQEVIDTMPMNEKTASLFHHFEPLYLVIDDMPRPPEVLLRLRDATGSERAESVSDVKEEEENAKEESSSAERPALQSSSEPVDSNANTILQDSGVSEGLVLTSDSESEIFCDSVDSVEQLSSIKVEVVKPNGLQNGHVHLEASLLESGPLESGPEARQFGAGRGGEGAEDGKDQGPVRRSRDAGREGSYHNWRERGVPQGSPRRPSRGASVAGGGAGRGGGDGSEGGADRLQDAQLQQQIVLALRRLREDMRSVMDRLEVVERLAATHAQSADWRPCLQCAATASGQQEERWWPFDVSGQTLLLLLLWPFVAQGLVFLLKKAQRRNHISS